MWQDSWEIDEIIVFIKYKSKKRWDLDTSMQRFLIVLSDATDV